MTKKIAVLSASGFGDGLLMMIAASKVKNSILFSKAYKMLRPLFPNQVIEPYPDHFDDKDYAQVIVEHDNSASARNVLRNRQAHTHFIFPTIGRHIDVTSRDHVCSNRLSMADNIAAACSKWLNTPFSKDIGIWTPDQKLHRKNKQRIIIHPMSKNPIKNWSKAQFLSLASKLKSEGFNPVFCVGPEEHADWKEIPFDLPQFESSKELAAFIFESGYFIGNDSGLGHLSSALQIPTLTISGHPRLSKLWRPGWHSGLVTALKVPLPNFKGIGLRIRENAWQPFVREARVLKDFRALVELFP